MTQPLSPSHKARPALTNATRSVEPPKASLWSEVGDDAAALQLLRPVSRPPQPVQIAHSLKPTMNRRRPLRASCWSASLPRPAYRAGP